MNQTCPAFCPWNGVERCDGGLSLAGEEGRILDSAAFSQHFNPFHIYLKIKNNDGKTLHTCRKSLYPESVRVCACARTCVCIFLSVSRFGSSFFLDLEEFGHVGEVFLVGFGHFLLRSLWIDDLQTLQREKKTTKVNKPKHTPSPS